LDDIPLDGEAMVATRKLEEYTMKRYITAILLALATLPAFAADTQDQHFYDRIVMKDGKTITGDVLYINTELKTDVLVYADVINADAKKDEKRTGGEIKMTDVAEIIFDEGNPAPRWAGITTDRRCTKSVAVHLKNFKDGVLLSTDKDNTEVKHKNEIVIHKYKNAKGSNVEDKYETWFEVVCLEASRPSCHITNLKPYQYTGYGDLVGNVAYTYGMLTSINQKPNYRTLEQSIYSSGAGLGDLRTGEPQTGLVSYFGKQGYTFEYRPVPTSRLECLLTLIEVVKNLEDGLACEWLQISLENNRGQKAKFFRSLVLYGFDGAGIKFGSGSSVASLIFVGDKYSSVQGFESEDVKVKPYKKGKKLVKVYDRMLVSKVFYKGLPLKGELSDERKLYGAEKRAYEESLTPDSIYLKAYHKVNEEVYGKDSECSEGFRKAYMSPEVKQARNEFKSGLITQEQYQKVLQDFKDGKKPEVKVLAPESGFDE
jgi:hypothetical protein